MEPTDEMVTAAMREFEKYAARLLRYPEKDRWHDNDVRGMREALKAANQVREAALVKSCKHPNRNANGWVSTDGSSRVEWHCPNCGASGCDETPARERTGLNALELLPRN